MCRQRGFATQARSDQESSPVFARKTADVQLDGTSRSNMGDRLASELGQTHSEALASRVNELQDQVKYLEAQLAASRKQ